MKMIKRLGNYVLGLCAEAISLAVFMFTMLAFLLLVIGALTLTLQESIAR